MVDNGESGSAMSSLEVGNMVRSCSGGARGLGTSLGVSLIHVFSYQSR